MKPEVNRRQPRLIGPWHELSDHHPEDDSRKDQRSDHERTEHPPAQIVPLLQRRCEEYLVRVLLEVAVNRRAENRGDDHQSEGRELRHHQRYGVRAVDEYFAAETARPELPDVN